MKRKIVSSMLVLTLAVGMLAGCGNKEPEVKDVSVAETKTENVTFNTTKLANVIAGDPVKLSDLLYEVVPDKKQEVKAVTLTYGNANITVEDGKEWKADTKETKDVKDVTFAVAGKKFSAKHVPDVNLTFHRTTTTAETLEVSVSLTDKNKKTSKATVDIKVRVLPETVKPAKAITENLKLSQSLKDYDFEARAKNILEKAKDTVESIKVTKSNVEFGTVGHYEVTYEIKTKPNGKLDVPTDVAVVDKSQEKSEDVITENVKPGETIKVTTGVDVVDKKTESTLPKDSVITDSKDTTAPPAGSTSTEDKTPAKGDESASTGGNNSGGNSGGSSDNGNAGGGNSGGGSTPAPEAPKPAPHSHSWTPHTATRNVWVPNIVTVTDYGNQAAHAYDTRCSECGAIFSSPDACADHTFSTGHGGAQNINCTHITQVVTGSHTEDHGYNTTESYTDYNYCSCGATQ